MFVGTGNPTPVLNGPARPGDNPWTCSIVALNPDTGKLVWGFQASPHDTHDWDAAEVPVLVDGSFNGAPRKMLLQASRNGYFFVLDRTTGKNLLTTPFATVNWASGIDKDGRPDSRTQPKSPLAMGVWWRRTKPAPPTTARPASTRRRASCSSALRTRTASTSSRPITARTGGQEPTTASTGRAALRAIDHQTGKIRWSHDLGDGAAGAGVLTTDTGLTFTGDAVGNALALRTTDGTTLWHSGIGRVGTGPITYQLDGRQYVLLGGGSALYAWALPERR